MKGSYFHPDIQYLKQFEIGNIICQALASAYQKNPKDPIKYIANWLISKSNSADVQKDVN